MQNLLISYLLDPLSALMGRVPEKQKDRLFVCGGLLIAVLTAVTVVLGMRLMGTLLISSLIVFPALTAMRVFRSFRAVTVCAALLSVVCFVAGMLASYWLSTPAGASVVCVNMIAYILFSVVGKWR